EEDKLIKKNTDSLIKDIRITNEFKIKELEGKEKDLLLTELLCIIDEAIMKLHENEPRFNLDAYHKEHCCGYPKEVEDLAMKIQKDEYKNLLLYVKLYKYYASNGYVDFENQEEVEFDKKWRYTLPIKSGTYDEISDYKKLVSLSKEYWNKIWDWMKAYGDKLND
ncbi:MAG: hypothetical protein J6W16_02280, partial [Methanobrevibacter sp.]|nr:hypothetical protein [Methanobrevibacter sp.]